MLEELNNVDEVNKMFKKYSDEYLNFGEIPDHEKLNKNSDLCGILYISKLLKNPERFDMETGHEIIYLPNVNSLKKKLTDHDVIYLRRCGISFESDFGCFAKFT